MKLLEVRNLKVAYGGIHALKGLDLEVFQGELVALIGANGAGKTTLLKTLAGLLRPIYGNIRYQDADLQDVPCHKLVTSGLALVPEGRGIFGRLTVAENLLMGAYSRQDKSAIDGDIEHVYEVFPRLQERSAQLAGTLSGGEQQMLAIGRALMSRPKLLLLDEPSMGLAPIMVQKIFRTIHEINEQGVTILLVEQNAKLALEISRRGYVMESGRIVLQDQATALLGNEKIKHAYLGE